MEFLKCETLLYLNDKSQIHGREIALIFRFSVESFELDFELARGNDLYLMRSSSKTCIAGRSSLMVLATGFGSYCIARYKQEI